MADNYKTKNTKQTNHQSLKCKDIYSICVANPLRTDKPYLCSMDTLPSGV